MCARCWPGADYSTWPHDVAATRDAFAILAGFAGAPRRSELAALRAGDVTWHPHDGLLLRLRASKTDQTGRGATIVVPFSTHPGTCGPCAWVRWARLLVAAPRGRSALMTLVLSQPGWEDWTHMCREPAPPLDEDVAVLRAIRRGGVVDDRAVSGDALHAMVKRRAAHVGYTSGVGFHSLRAGFVTQARRNGADTRAIRLQTRHTSDAMIDVYDREHAPALGNAVLELGL